MSSFPWDESSLIIKYSRMSHARCGHLWCRLPRFDCILLVFIRRWGRLLTRHLLSRMLRCDRSIGFQQLWLMTFDPRCFGVLFPRRSAVARFSCCCVSWSWASMLPEFLFHYSCWYIVRVKSYENRLFETVCTSEDHDQWTLFRSKAGCIQCC